VNPDPLAQLRDYHLPDPVSWWPPAPGWWLLAVLLLALSAWLIILLLRRYRRRAARREALAELKELEQAHARDGDPTALLRGLSRLLRRFALARFPQKQVAGLSSEAWLAFLDAQGQLNGFRDGPGRLLADGPYRPDIDREALNELIPLVRRWIQRNPGAAR